MIFEQIAVGPLAVNCFILGCENSHDGIVVDPGGNVELIEQAVRKHGLKISVIINTHGHFDHVGGNGRASSLFGARLLIHQADTYLLDKVVEVAGMYGMVGENSPEPDEFLQDGMEITFGTYAIKVLHTPGHTPGGCCLHIESENLIITGDTLFADSIGRTDFPGGSHEQLLESIRSKLFTLPDSVIAYPGHGPETTIGHEKKSNPYF